MDLAEATDEKIHPLLLFDTERTAGEEVPPILAHLGDVECLLKPLPTVFMKGCVWGVDENFIPLIARQKIFCWSLAARCRYKVCRDLLAFSECDENTIRFTPLSRHLLQEYHPEIKGRHHG